jgi:hypothetical protein
MGAYLELGESGGADGGYLASKRTGVRDDGVGGSGGGGGGHGGREEEQGTAAESMRRDPRGGRVPAARGVVEAEEAEERARERREQGWAHHGPHFQMVGQSSVGEGVSNI